MNNIDLTVLPQVVEFVEKVRLRLSDLDPEVRNELTDGLEADLSELVAEHGGSQPLGEISLEDVVGPPEEYADELRSAADLPAYQALMGKPRRIWGEVLDGWRNKFLVLTSQPALRGIWQALVGFRPIWWIVRAWAACLLVDELVLTPYARGASFLPTENVLLGVIVVMGASALSVQIGRGRLWPGTQQASARTVLGLLNALAVVVVPTIIASAIYIHDQRVEQLNAQRTEQLNAQLSQRGLTNDGVDVCNIQPYDAAGNPLYGVQLFDELGSPLVVGCQDWSQEGYLAWKLGDIERWNVFPLGLPDPLEGEDQPFFPPRERMTVPGVTSPAPPPTAGEVTGATSRRRFGASPAR